MSWGLGQGHSRLRFSPQHSLCLNSYSTCYFTPEVLVKCTRLHSLSPTCPQIPLKPSGMEAWVVV